MRYKHIVTGLLLIFSILVSQSSFSVPLQKKKKVSNIDSVKVSVDYLNYFLSGKDGWKPQNEELAKTLRGLIHFVEDEKIDTILHKVSEFTVEPANQLFYRPYNLISDSLQIEGYVSNSQLIEQLKRIDREVRNTVVREEIPVPEQLMENLTEKVPLLKRDEADLLLRDSRVILPDSIQSFEAIPDSTLMSPADFRRIQRMDSLKRVILENARLEYNNNLLQHYIDSISSDYREQVVLELSKREQQKLRDEIKNSNNQKLIAYNDSVVKAVNDTIFQYLDVLTSHAENDSTLLWVQNSERDITQIWLRKNDPYSKRMYIKNEQNDSLGIRLRNIDKNAIQILIDDGVTFNRFSQQQSKGFKFDELMHESNLRKVEKKYNVITPWTLGGDGTVGFTQTYLNNWKKGGKSALSTLMVLKGFANYSEKKIKWENNAELRNGWLKPGGDKIQKNDDKFEIISRFGISAFKKWYYSAELDFETQLFNGYNYPNRDNPISGFLAPSRTLMKFGLDYKPNKNFSLFLSPFTSKTVYVRDTVKIDQTKFGIDKDKKRYWEPGLNADIRWKKDIDKDMSYELKYKMFINYSEPFSKFDISWENNFVMRLNDFINMRVMLHLLYDDNVKFPIYREIDGAQVEVGKEPKWQVKEFISVGFSYKLNKRVYRRRLVN
ncbi:DUF3078 domain-containing protein [Sunxiuqinia sp. A32]|uniref:DUF3078 domain-containing protein n=1 Tax=Sunxiuqinia sp. A32 TaxID=3461496 RepID=UPI00404561A7